MFITFTLLYRLSCFSLLYIFCSTSITFTQKYLTNKQWNYIKYIINNYDSSDEKRLAVNNVLYKKYYEWGYHKAYQFKKMHWYKCRHININDLEMYSSLGLIQAIRNYNTSYVFHHYAEMYIQYTLYKGLTDLFPITKISRAERKQKQLYSKVKERIPTKYIGKDEWRLNDNDKLPADETSLYHLQKIIHEDTYKEYWRNIEKMDAFSRKIMYYKFNFYFTKIRSNLEIAELMATSEETVRKTVKRTLKSILYI